MEQIQARMESALSRFLPSAEATPQRLHQAMRYAVLGGGKRVRPLLAFAAGELVRADAAKLEAVAASIEFIHVYSLVHDDLPCMDDDVLRRGKPTCHIQYDEATALLVGDSLQSLAFQLLAENSLANDVKTQLEMVQILTVASGSRGMAGGQAIDLDSVGKKLTLPELENMHLHKTGALIRASVALGARCGNHLSQAELQQLDYFAKIVGLMFQVVDDILDVEASSSTLGKTAGKDAQQNKPTYVSLMGMNEARALANKLYNDGLEILSKFGESALRLRELADFIVKRSF